MQFKQTYLNTESEADGQYQPHQTSDKVSDVRIQVHGEDDHEEQSGSNDQADRERQGCFQQLML